MADRRKSTENIQDAHFLREAFTSPKMMEVLAKAGFTQSYTYFTWRNTKQELPPYLTELTQTEMRYTFAGQSFSEYAGYLATLPSVGRAPAVPHSCSASGHALAGLRNLQRVRALRKHPRSGQRGIS